MVSPPCKFQYFPIVYRKWGICARSYMQFAANIFRSVTLSLRKKRSGTYRFSFVVTPKILMPTFFKELRGNICPDIGGRKIVGTGRKKNEARRAIWERTEKTATDWDIGEAR